MNAGAGGTAPSEALDGSTVRAALARLLASNDFVASPQLAAFLRHVVEQTLAGRQETIKGYTIATEALGRDASFDPQADPIVRVEATRLRRALERYYRTTGRHDPVEITIAKGAYVPRFRRRTPGADRDAPASRRSGLQDTAPRLAGDETAVLPGPAGRVLRVAAPIGCAIAIAVVLLALAGRNAAERVGARTAASPSTTQVMRLSVAEASADLPVLRVQPFREVGSPARGPVGAYSLALRLRDALARFDEIMVIGESASGPRIRSIRRAAVVSTPVKVAAAAGGASSASNANYTVSGWMEALADDGFTLSVSLTADADGRVVWTRQFEAERPDPEPGRAEARLSREIATTIGQADGVLLSDLRARFAVAGGLPSRFGCLLLVQDFWNSYTEASHRRARDCLEAVLQANPGFSLALANLAFMEVEGYRANLDRRPGEPPLDRALAAVRKALTLRPESSRAREALMSVLFSRGDFDDAFAAGDDAMRANPFDPVIMADIGARKIQVGAVDAGRLMIEDAGTRLASRPLWYEFALFLAAFLRGDQAGMSQHASRMMPDDYALALVARAVAQAEAGTQVEANDTAMMLGLLHPRFASAPRAALTRYGGSQDVIGRLADGLAKAGLRSATEPHD